MEEQKGLNLPVDEVKYLTPLSPTFTIQLAGEQVQAVNGVLTVTQAQAKEIELLVTKHRRYDIAANIKRIDFEEAEKRAKEWLAKNTKSAAVKGAMSSAHDPKNVLREADKAQRAEFVKAAAQNSVDTTANLSSLTAGGAAVDNGGDISKSQQAKPSPFQKK